MLFRSVACVVPGAAVVCGLMGLGAAASAATATIDPMTFSADVLAGYNGDGGSPRDSDALDVTLSGPVDLAIDANVSGGSAEFAVNGTVASTWLNLDAETFARGVDNSPDGTGFGEVAFSLTSNLTVTESTPFVLTLPGVYRSGDNPYGNDDAWVRLLDAEGQPVMISTSADGSGQTGGADFEMGGGITSDIHYWGSADNGVYIPNASDPTPLYGTLAPGTYLFEFSGVNEGSENSLHLDFQGLALQVPEPSMLALLPAAGLALLRRR